MHLLLLARGEELWQEQAQVLGADLISVPEADHFLLLDRSELVLKAIQQVVEAGRDPRTEIESTPDLETPGPLVASLAVVCR